MAKITFSIRTAKQLAVRSTGLLKITFCILALVIFSFAQGERSPSVGFQAGNSYAISDIEKVNLQNGNLMLNIPLASLSPGRGTSPGYTVALQYNSKIWESQVQYKTNGNPDQSGNTSYTKEILKNNRGGGWALNSGGYVLEVVNRMGLDEVPCNVNHQSTYSRNGYAFKVQMHTPDGGIVTFRPYGAGVAFNDQYGDDYFSIDPTGLRHIYDMNYMGGAVSCTYGTEPIDTNGMDYYSTDGSATRLSIPAGSTGVGHWTLHLSDGSKVEYNPADDTTVFQRITDRNGNKVVWKGATVNGLTGTKIQNDLGKYVFVSNLANNENKIITEGFGGAQLVTTLSWKTVYIRHRYMSTMAFNAPQFEKYVEALWSPRILDKITLPDQASNLEYKFTYHADDTAPPAEDYTEGWGELKSVTLPSQAKAEYEFSGDIFQFMTPQFVLLNSAEKRTLTYQKEYDGSSELATEITLYNGIASVITPDGGRLSEGVPMSPTFPGYNCRTFNPDGTISEKIWANNIATMVSGNMTNVYVKTEFTSIADANGNPVLTAIKDYDYDKNGNVLEVREYDWVLYSYVPRIGTGIYVQPTGLPDNEHLILKRKTVNTYYNPTPIATDTSFSGNSYAEPTSPRLHNVIKSSEIRDGSGNVNSRSEFYYDDPNTTGNLIETRSWDNTKGAYSSPLTPGANGNSISTYTAYDSYGNPTLETDAKGNQTQITYGSVSGFSGLYPTQTITAYGTAIQRTATAAYDFTTGLVISSTDVDNGVTNATEYDALGRPTKAITAQTTALESGAQMEYSDTARRVIVRGDLEIKGDGKKVAIQHYDQLGRVRLSRTLENAATEDPYNEATGIKVQTRYAYNAPTDPENSNGAYTLTSNPYRAGTSGGASGEPTMGWSRSYSNQSGWHSEATTYSGASLPAPWGSNTNSTGTVATDRDTDRTLVTDQAGKQRISKTNVFGQLSNVWEVTGYDTATVAVSFAGHSEVGYGYQTDYTYDTLGNLITVNQGSQPRSFAYSTLSRLTSAQNPESGTISYAYDAGGNLTSKSQVRSGTANVLTSYNYDALNRVTQRSYTTPNGTPDYYQATPTVTYTYDDKTHAKGKLTKVSSSVSTTEFVSFDEIGRITRSKQTTDNVVYGDDTHPMTYTYNLSGGLVEQKYPSGRVVKNTLDASGDLAEVESKKNSSSVYWSYANSFTYNAAGTVAGMRLGNGLWESTAFNARLQPTQIALGNMPSTTNLLKLDYSFGTTQNNGNVQSQTITVPGLSNAFVQSYTYDSLNRILSATETNNSSQTWKETFTYDRYGNRNFDEANTTTLTKACGTSPNFTVCSADRKKENPSVDTSNNHLNTSDNYAYDLAGNTTSDANFQSYIYDGENKIVQGSSSSGTLGTYYYDGNGNRVKKVLQNGETTVFLYDATGMVAAEYSTQLDPAPQTNYLTNDLLGSPRINTNANGGIISRHDYHPFGEEVATSQRTAGIGYNADNVRKKFTGKERDAEITLDYFGARYYSYFVGRFTSVDPIDTTKERLLDPQRLNLFAYVRNNPTIFLDPDGKDVHVAIGTQAVGTATIRVVGATGNQPKTIEVSLYKMVVWDDVNGDKNISTYYVTRDAPVIDQANPTTQEIGDAGGVLYSGPLMNKIINSTFEPAGNEDGGYKLVPLAYPEKTDLEAYSVRNQDGSDKLAAEPNDSPDRKDKNFATGVMIHVGGNFVRLNGEQRTMGSLGCFGVSGGNQTMKNFVADIKKRQELNKKNNKGDTIYLRIGKRKNAPKGWTVPVSQ